MQRKEDEVLCHRLNIIGITVFFLFFAFRGYIWHDWMGYYPSFEKMEWSDILYYDYIKNREPLWFVFNLTIKSLTNSYQVMIIAVSAIQTWLLVRFFRLYSVNILLSLSIFSAYAGLELSINLLRNFTAICIFLNALPYIEAKKSLKYYSLCLIAILVHLSSVFYLPLYFVLNRRLNKWIYLALILLSNASLFANVPIVLRLISLTGIGGELVEYKIESYSSYGTFAVNRIEILIKFIFCILVFLYYNKLIKQRESNKIFINALIVYIIGSYFTVEFTEMSNRIGKLFVFAFWILCGSLTQVFFHKNNQLLYASFLALVVLYNTYYSSGERLKEYQNFLFGNADSYNERLKNFNRYFEQPKQIQQKK